MNRIEHVSMKVLNMVMNFHNQPNVVGEVREFSMGNDCCFHLTMNEYYSTNGKRSEESMVQFLIDDVLDEDDVLVGNTNVD